MANVWRIAHRGDGTDLGVGQSAVRPGSIYFRRAGVRVRSFLPAVIVVGEPYLCERVAGAIQNEVLADIGRRRTQCSVVAACLVEALVIDAEPGIERVADRYDRTRFRINSVARNAIARDIRSAEDLPQRRGAVAGARIQEAEVAGAIDAAAVIPHQPDAFADIVGNREVGIAELVRIAEHHRRDLADRGIQSGKGNCCKRT